MRQVTGKSDRVARKLVTVILALWCVLATPAGAEDLKPKTVEAFDHYVQLTESQIDSETASHGPYLWVERLPEDRRAAAEAQLRAGQVVIERLDTLDPDDHGKRSTAPDGMIHHWIGTVFIPGAKLAQTLPGSKGAGST